MPSETSQEDSQVMRIGHLTQCLPPILLIRPTVVTLGNPEGVAGNCANSEAKVKFVIIAG
jgi:hypothetical protein